ncbi:MAG: TolC family outer membrane protein [Spongiibacteraceae bacterium]
MNRISRFRLKTIRLSSISAALCCSLLTGTHAYADSLRDIYELAIKNDAKLKAAEATYKANLETEQQAKSRLLPQLNGEASYGKVDRDQDSQSLTGSSLFDLTSSKVNTQTDTTDKSWGVSLTQALFDMPSWFSFKSGRVVSEQAKAQFSADQQDLIVRVAEAYFTVLRQWDNLQVALAEERADKRQLEQAQQRFDVGLVAITDVHEARAAYDASYASRLTDEGALASAYETLSTFTGQPHANLSLLNKEFPVTEPAPNDRAEWVNFALNGNYALKAARYAMEAAEENAASKRWEHAPKLTGSLSYKHDDVSGTTDTNPQSLLSFPPDAQTDTKAAMLNLTVPIYSGGYTSSAQRQAAAQYSATLERKTDTERSVIQGTRARHIAANTDVQRVKARAQSIISAQSALDATKAGYEVGTRNIVDVLQTQRVFFAAQRDYANARYDYVLDMLRLKQVAGTLSPQDINDLNDWLVAPDSPKASTYTITEDKTPDENTDKKTERKKR